MAEDSNEYRLAVKNLKARLKEMQITYAELADGIGMSESGVKKIFTGSDGSFQRLAQICRYAGLTVAEILESPEIRETQFSPEQQTEFLKEPQMFQFYWLIAYERRPIGEASQFFKLTKADEKRQLETLQRLGLLKVLPNGQIRLPPPEALRWSGDGLFMRKITQDWSQKFSAKMAKTVPSANEYFLLRYLKMRPETYKALLRAQKDLEREFVIRATREAGSAEEDLQHVRWMTAVDDESFVQD